MWNEKWNSRQWPVLIFPLKKAWEAMKQVQLLILSTSTSWVSHLTYHKSDKASYKRGFTLLSDFRDLWQSCTTKMATQLFYAHKEVLPHQSKGHRLNNFISHGTCYLFQLEREGRWHIQFSVEKIKNWKHLIPSLNKTVEPFLVEKNKPFLLQRESSIII